MAGGKCSDQVQLKMQSREKETNSPICNVVSGIQQIEETLVFNVIVY